MEIKIERKSHKSSFAFCQSAEGCSGRKEIPDSRPHCKIKETKNRKEKLKENVKKVPSPVDRALKAAAAGKQSPIVGLTIKLKRKIKGKIETKSQKSSFAFCQSAEGCSGRKTIPDSRPLVNRAKQLFLFPFVFFNFNF